MRFSPLLLAVALAPALMQTQFTCVKTGDPTLSILELEVLGENRIVGFEPEDLSYDVWLPLAADTAMVRAYSTDPAAQVMYNYNTAKGPIDYDSLPLGGDEFTLDGLLVEGESKLLVSVKAPGGATHSYVIRIRVGCSNCDDENDCTTEACSYPDEICTHTAKPDRTECALAGDLGLCISGACDPFLHPCTEQGILDAVAAGRGPHRFDCDGPSTVSLTGEIVIDQDVVLDGEGRLTLSRSEPGPSAISITEGSTVTLKGIVVTGISRNVGRACAGILNQGVLTLIESTVSDNYAEEGACAGICADGPTTLIDSQVVGNVALECTGICGDVRLVSSSLLGNSGWGSATCGSVELIESTISDNDACGYASGQCYGGPLIYGDVYAYRSTISNNYAGISDLITGDSTLINSTVSGNPAAYTVYARLILNSTLVAGPHPRVFPYETDSVLVVGGGQVANSLIVNPYASSSSAAYPSSACLGWRALNSAGGNIESPEGSCGLSDPTDQSNVSIDALNLGPLQDNGGPTQTHALLPGSVALDQIPAEDCVDTDGAPLTTDQRGEPRPAGPMCDVGAFELQPSSETDTDPPILVDFDFNPKYFDINGADVVCSISATDVPAGVDYVDVAFHFVPSGHSRRCRATLTSGTRYDGTFTCTIIFEPWYPAGADWEAVVTLTDTVGNRTAYGKDDLEALGFPAVLYL